MALDALGLNPSSDSYPLRPSGSHPELQPHLLAPYTEGNPSWGSQMCQDTPSVLGHLVQLLETTGRLPIPPLGPLRLVQGFVRPQRLQGDGKNADLSPHVPRGRAGGRTDNGTRKGFACVW